MDRLDRAEDVARILLEIGAVTIRVARPFRYRSGLLSPIYTDNRLLCSYPHHRRQITKHFIGLLEEECLKPAMLAGVATAGIPHTAWLANELDIPMVYVRSEAKDHGKGKRVEGTLFPYQSGPSPSIDFDSQYSAHSAIHPPDVMVVEDHVTTGGGTLEAVDGLRSEGACVTYCLAIYTYDLPEAKARFVSEGVTLLPLCRFDDLVRVARGRGYVTESEREAVLDWQAEPRGWADRQGSLVGA